MRRKARASFFCFVEKLITYFFFYVKKENIDDVDVWLGDVAELRIHCKIAGRWLNLGLGYCFVLSSAEIFSVDPEKMEPLRFQSLAVRFENLLGLNSNSDREKISVVMANAIYEKVKARRVAMATRPATYRVPPSIFFVPPQVQEQIKMQFSQVLTEYLNEQVREEKGNDPTPSNLHSSTRKR